MKSNQQIKATNKRGRKKGSKPSHAPVLFDRWELLFYTTTKDTAGRVIGRDYSNAQQHISDMDEKRKRAISCDELIFMKAAKSAKYKEDIFKKRIDLVIYQQNYQSNGIHPIKPNRARSLLRLEKE